MEIRAWFLGQVVAALLLFLISAPSIAADAKFGAIVLMQPEQSWQLKRIDIKTFAAFIEAVKAAVTDGVRDDPAKSGDAYLILAVRDDGKVNAWLDLEQPMGNETATRILIAAKAQKAFPVLHGTVVFAIRVLLGEASGASKPRQPFPPEWKAHAAGRSAEENEVEKLVERVWPRATKTASVRPPFPVPDGFEVQPLDPFGGRIAKPKGWYFHSRGTPTGWLWVLAEQDPAKGKWDTGSQIQLIAQVSKKAGKSPEEFVRDTLQQIKKSSRVLRECEVETVGEFRRQCLEVVETVDGANGKREFRHLYTLSWHVSADMVVIALFATTPDKWESLRETHRAMSVYEVIGPAEAWKLDGAAQADSKRGT